MANNFLMTAGVGLICGVVGAAGYFYFLGPKSNDSAEPEQTESHSGKQAVKKKKSEFSGTQTVMESNSHGAAWIPGFTSQEDAETLKKQIANLVRRFDGLTERVDRMTRPKDETPPVLHTLQIKMEELARAMDEVSMLPAKVRRNDSRVETLREEIRTLRSRVEALTGGAARIETPALASPRANTAVAAPQPKSDIEDGGPQMDLGISLLQRGQYVSAREVFERLQNADPRDARVWYFAALATGLSTGKWDGDAKKFADEGIELERKSSPSTADVDAALATRVPIEGVPWLNSLRRRALTAKTKP
jgi:TolA-binding protein